MNLTPFSHVVYCSACNEPLRMRQLDAHWESVHSSTSLPQCERYFILIDPSQGESVHLLGTDSAEYVHASDKEPQPLSQFATAVPTTELKLNVQNMNHHGSSLMEFSALFQNKGINYTASINDQDLMIAAKAMTPTLERLTVPLSDPAAIGSNNKKGSKSNGSTLLVPIASNMRSVSFNVLLSEVFHELEGQYDDDSVRLEEDWGHLEDSQCGTGDDGHGNEMKESSFKRYEKPSLKCIPKENIVVNIDDIFIREMTIGFGSSCRVTKAKCIETGQYHALKQIAKGQHKGDGVTSKELLITEGKVLRALRHHDNIVSLSALYETPGHYFIVTELMSGGTLLERLLRSIPSERTAAKYTHDILCAVAYMHSKNVVHNDLKLENIMFSKPGKEGVLKLIDFGHSQTVEDSNNKLYRSTFGTLHYVPPEITRALKCGRSASELKKSDVWAVGVCTYALLTGYTPFCGKTMKEVLHNINRRKTEGLRFPQKCFLKKESVDFVERLLCIDVEERLSAKEAMKHPFITCIGGDHSDVVIPLLALNEMAESESKEMDSNSDQQEPELKNNVLDSESVSSVDRSSTTDSAGSGVDTESLSSLENETI